MRLIFKPKKNSLEIEVLLKNRKKLIAKEIAKNSLEIDKAIDRIFLLSKIDKYCIKKVEFITDDKISDITASILKSLTKTINFLLSLKKEQKNFNN